MQNTIDFELGDSNAYFYQKVWLLESNKQNGFSPLFCAFPFFCLDFTFSNILILTRCGDSTAWRCSCGTSPRSPTKEEKSEKFKIFFYYCRGSALLWCSPEPDPHPIILIANPDTDTSLKPDQVLTDKFYGYGGNAARLLTDFQALCT